MTNKQRYEVGNTDLETLTRELKEFVDSGKCPGSDYQKDRHVITRNFHFPRMFLEYLLNRRN